MPLRSPSWPLHGSLVALAPDLPGLYALWRRGALVFLGSAPGGRRTLRALLSAHLAAADRRPRGAPTHFSYEICSRPAKREAELLDELRYDGPQGGWPWKTGSKTGTGRKSATGPARR